MVRTLHNQLVVLDSHRVLPEALYLYHVRLTRGGLANGRGRDEGGGGHLWRNGLDILKYNIVSNIV